MKTGPEQDYLKALCQAFLQVEKIPYYDENLQLHLLLHLGDGELIDIPPNKLPDGFKGKLNIIPASKR